VGRRLKSLEKVLFKYNIEARGVERVLPEDRHDTTRFGFVQVCLVWISINLEAIMITLGMLGPAVYYLPFTEACLLGVFGALLGSLPVAYIATFGPRSGLRTMILTRYVTGWYPSKLIVVLTLIVFLGYLLIDAVIGGQILSAVSVDDSLSVIVGIVIVCVLSWAVSTCGYAFFHAYERYAWLPQLIILSLLAGVAGPKFDLTANPSEGSSPAEIAGNRLSFFSLCLASQITYAQAAADFFVYYPVATSRTKMFLSTTLGLTVSSAFTLILGIGLASGTASVPEWNAAYQVSQGALIVEAFRPLGGFGSFCSVLLALGLVGNMVPPLYASGIDFQALGRPFARVPRIFWTILAIAIPLVAAIAGREYLAQIFTNFLALMGYWVSIWIAIVLEEHLLFREGLVGKMAPTTEKGWEWEAWNDRERLPLGIAAVFAFLVGWAGAVLCMAQVYYVGPLARLISEYGGDVSIYLFLFLPF
jgi:NCS1 nucleoside transporter family